MQLTDLNILFAGKTLGIYNVAGIVATALPFAVTPANILAGFKCTGIHPFKRDIFTDQDFSDFLLTGLTVP